MILMAGPSEKRVYAYVVADILNVGHTRHLKRAKQLGTYLIVGVLTAEATMEKKPKPIMSVSQRMEIITALQCVDQVVKQETYSPRDNLLRYRIDVLAESVDHENPRELQDIVVVEVLPYTKGESSSRTKERIIHAAAKDKRS